MYCENCGYNMPDGYSFCPHCGNPNNVTDKNNMSPFDYEECVAERLRRDGYKNVYTTQKSGDYGADVIGTSPKGERVCVQCKKYNNPVGVKAVQEIYSAKAYYKCDLAYVFTTSSFTPQAQQMADRIGVKLFVFIPDYSSQPERHYAQPKRKKASYQSKSNNTGTHHFGLLIFILIIGVIVFAVSSVKKEETKKREIRKEIVVSAVNKDEDPTASISIEPSTEEQEKPISVIVDGVCYLLVDDHLEVFCLYDVKRTNIRISESIDGIPVTVIKSEAFHNEENIITVALPSSITDIQQGAFATCRKLTSINLPDGLTEISDNAFILCQSLQAISIPNTVKRIGSGAFDGTALSTISLENVEIIEDNAFASCKLSSVYLSSELKEICDRAFNNNRHLQKITIPEGVTFIGRECFQYCENLKSITLPESLTSIGIRCFDGCKTLKEIKIPPNVESLSGTQMFSGDVSLEVIYVPADCKIPNGEKPFDGCNARIVFY